MALRMKGESDIKTFSLLRGMSFVLFVLTSDTKNSWSFMPETKKIDTL